MNKSGQVFVVGLMIGLLAFIAIVAVSGAIKEQVSTARTNLDCTNTSLSPGETATCIIVDWSGFAFLGIGVVVAASWLLTRRIQLNQGGG